MPKSSISLIWKSLYFKIWLSKELNLFNLLSLVKLVSRATELRQRPKFDTFQKTLFRNLASSTFLTLKLFKLQLHPICKICYAYSFLSLQFKGRSLLSPETEQTSCLMSCQMTKELRSLESNKFQENPWNELKSTQPATKKQILTVLLQN